MKKLLLSFVLALLITPCLTLSADALDASDYEYVVLDRKTSTIAPGVTQDTVYARMLRDGNQMVYYVLKADISRDDVNVYVNYKDNQWEEWGMSKLSDQMAAAQEIHSDPDSGRYIENYTVVAGVNGDYYEMSNGKPLYAFGMEGHLRQVPGDRYNPNNPGVGFPFFAVLDSGKQAVCYPQYAWNTSDSGWNWVTQHTKELIGGDPVLVNIDGSGNPFVDAINYGYDNQNDLNARTAIGVNQNFSQVIMVVVDGKQLPFSRGASMGDLGTIMVNEGCYYAMNLDGGGSSTMITKAEGSNDLEIVNKPCDGYERIISSSLMIVSTYVDENAFDHAVLTPEHDYVTPGAAVTVDARGSTKKGAAADLPANGAWQLKAGSAGLGSISADGVFTSNGTAGDVTVQYVAGSDVKGEAVIHVVIPDSFSFTAPSFAVPFGESIDLTVTAAFKDHTVWLRDTDVTMTLSSDSLGSLAGSRFTAVSGAEGEISGTVTATLTCAGKTAEANLTVGRGSVIIFDFEDPGSVNQFTARSAYDYLHIQQRIEHVTAETGKVHDGNGALAFYMDCSQVHDGFGAGVYQAYLAYAGTVDLTNAVGIGAWVWVPDEEYVTQLWWTVAHFNQNNVRGTKGNLNDVGTYGYYGPGYGANYDEGHWVYTYISLESLAGYRIELEKGLSFLNFGYWPAARNHAEKSTNNKLVFYVDSITVDYSSVVSDRDAPMIADVTMDGQALLQGLVADSSSGTVSVQAGAADSIINTNTSGIDPDSVEAYVDGVKVPASYRDGIVTMDAVKLAAGVHSIKLGIADRMGNYSSVTRYVRVSGNQTVPTVKVVPHDPLKDKIPIGSLYYIDVVATDIRAIDEIVMDLDLNNTSAWELDHAVVDPSFSFTYTIDGLENIATLHFARTADSENSGEQIIASLPIRTWVPPEEPYEWYDKDGQPYTWTVEWAWENDALCPTDITVYVDRGEIVYADGTEVDTMAVFGGERIQVDTELYAVVPTLKGAGKAGIHTHNAQPDNIAAACTEPGISGRTYCEECESFVDWGEAVEPLGHDYRIDEDDLFKCAREGCGELYNGIWQDEDGGEQEFVDGVLQNGWLGGTGRYYRSGVYVTGFQTIDGLLYDFGDDGRCAGQTPYTGVHEDFYYAEGEKTSSWYNDSYYDQEKGMLTGFRQLDDGLWYDFGDDGVCADRTPFTGVKNGLTYVNGALKQGWTDDFRYYRDGEAVDGFQQLADDKFYLFVDGVCENKTPFTGTHDGITYENGSPADGWLDDSYYVGGDKYRGFHSDLGDGLLYNFGTDGVCAGREPYTGEYENDYYTRGVKDPGWHGGSYYDAEDGKLNSGFYVIDGVLYEFDSGECTDLDGHTGEYGGLYYAQGRLYTGWTDDYRYYADGEMLTGYRKLEDDKGEELLYFFDGETGICADGKPYTGEYNGQGYRDGAAACGWINDMYFDETEGKLTGFQFIGGLLYEFDEDGVCEGQRAFTGTYHGQDYINGRIVEGWTDDDCYYVDGVKLTGIQVLEDLYFDFGTDGVCEGRRPITGFFEMDGEHYYAVAGELEIGWFSVGENRYHSGEDGRVHSGVDAVNTTTCTQDGRWEYTCEECGEQDFGQTLWSEGHNWDDDHVCSKCGTVGINIADATLVIAGTYFTYTGTDIRAAHTVTYNGRQLRVRSDRMGTDGYSMYSNNTDIGVATLTVEGRGDFYGELTGKFTIVPASIDEVIAAQTGDSGLTLRWEAALGADFYEVYHQVGTSWVMVDSTGNTSCDITGLAPGGVYAYRVASVATRNGSDYYCTKWADVSGTLDHMWGEVTVEKEVTCTEDGLESRVCADCGERDDVVIPALGHDVEEWETTKEATTSAAGSRHGICANCGEDIVEEIPRLPGGGSGNSGSGGGTSSSTTTTNPDGSTTTTTTDRTTGTVTETTTNTDGSVSTKETRTDGTVTQTTTNTDGSSKTVETKADGTVTETTTKTDGSSKAVETKTDGTVTTTEKAANNVETRTVSQPGRNVTAEVTIPSEVKSATVTIPDAEITPGTVAIDADTGEIIMLCVPTEDGLEVSLDSSRNIILVDNSIEFTDLNENHWAESFVAFVSSHRLFIGTSEDTFSPEASTSRAHLMTVLARLDGSDTSGNALRKGMEWAVREGISDGSNPDENISRQQVAVMLWRYAGSPESSWALTASDAGDAADYARTALAWAMEMGILTGYPDGRLDPNGSASRAHVAAMVQRFCAILI